MKDNLLKFALAASLILNLTVFATAGYYYYQQPRTWVSPFGRVMEKNKFIFEELSLKPEQLAAMKSKALAFRAEIDRRRQVIDARRNELVTLLRDQNPDKKAIDTTIKEISGKQEEMQRMIAGHMLEIR
jgi:Spy/CpxP family protein refolding chaperone